MVVGTDPPFSYSLVQIPGRPGPPSSSIFGEAPVTDTNAGATLSLAPWKTSVHGGLTVASFGNLNQSQPKLEVKVGGPFCSWTCSTREDDQSLTPPPSKTCFHRHGNWRSKHTEKLKHAFMWWKMVPLTSQLEHCSGQQVLFKGFKFQPLSCRFIIFFCSQRENPEWFKLWDFDVCIHLYLETTIRFFHFYFLVAAWVTHDICINSTGHHHKVTLYTNGYLFLLLLSSLCNDLCFDKRERFLKTSSSSWKGYITEGGWK